MQYTGRSDSISKGSISIARALFTPKFPKKHVCYFARKRFKMNPMEKEYSYKLKPCILYTPVITSTVLFLDYVQT